MNDINNKTDGIYDDLLPNTTMRHVFRSPQAKFVLSVNYAVEITQIDNGNGIFGMVGPYAAKEFEGTSPVLVENGNIPMIGYWDRSSSLGSATHFPNMLRVVPGTYVEGRVLASVVSEFFHWSKVSLFFTSDEFNFAADIFSSRELGITILSAHPFHSSRKNLKNIIMLPIL